MHLAPLWVDPASRHQDPVCPRVGWLSVAVAVLGCTGALRDGGAAGHLCRCHSGPAWVVVVLADQPRVGCGVSRKVWRQVVRVSFGWFCANGWARWCFSGLLAVALFYGLLRVPFGLCGSDREGHQYNATGQRPDPSTLRLPGAVGWRCGQPCALSPWWGTSSCGCVCNGDARGARGGVWPVPASGGETCLSCH